MRDFVIALSQEMFRARPARPRYSHDHENEHLQLDEWIE